MLKILPIQSKAEQEQLCERCGAAFDPDMLAYAASVDDKIAGICQFKLTDKGGIISTFAPAKDFYSRDALFVLGRGTLNFIDLCGVHYATSINVSMLLLHTKNPAILIDVLSDHLSENGQMIVLDIDDGFTVAHPDPEGMFEKAIRYCYKTEYSGFRHCGRAINKFFVDTDLQDIRLHRLGLSNIGLSRKEREDLFEVYFWFVLDDLKKMSEENPDDQYVYSEYVWMRDHYASMKNAFKKKEFFFTLGFILYSAHNGR